MYNVYIYIFNIITNITRPPQNRKIWNLETWCKTLIHSPSSVSIAHLTVLLRPFWSSSAEAWTSQVSWHGCEGRVTSDVAKGPRDPFRPPGEIGGWKDPKKAKRRWWFMDDLWMIFGSSSHVFWKKLETFNWVEPLAGVSGDPLEGDWRFWREQEPRLQLWQMSGFWMVKAANATAWPSDHLYKWHKPKTTGALTIWVDQRIGMNWVWAP